MNETLTVYTMNLSYDTFEDRLNLLLTNDEQSINLWLTRSLTQRLLKGLSERANWQLIDVNLGWLARKETALADMPVVGHC
jgi:hypothetical protein